MKWILLVLTIAFKSLAFGQFIDRHQISTYSTNGAIVMQGDQTQIQILTAYSYLYKKGIQVGFDGGLADYNGYSFVKLMGTAHFNFPDSWTIQDSYFVGGGVGFIIFNDTPDDGNKFAVMVEGGKRFQWGDRFSFSPFIRIGLVDDQDTVIHIVPASASFYF